MMFPKWAKDCRTEASEMTSLRRRGDVDVDGKRFRGLENVGETFMS